MASSARPSSVIRFGAFELDAASEELRKSGVLLRLHPQPFRLLLLLAGRPGQIVDREEIQHILWGGNTFVDFEGGINHCIKQLRDALGDSTEKPRYVETIPRRGYRFIATVTTGEPREQVIPFPHAVVSPEPPRQAGRGSAAALPVRNIQSTISSVATTRFIWTNKRVAPIVVIALGLLALLVAVDALYLRRAPKFTQKDTVVLADFKNTTGDGVFDDALKQALAVELDQSPYLDVLSERKARETLQMMGRPSGERVTTEVARELCLRTGSRALLGGSISLIGSHYLVELSAVACNGDSIAREQAEARSKEEVLRALSRAASGMRAKLGESLPSVQKYDVPIEATTTSLEALMNYSMGAKVGYEQGDSPSIPFFQRALELDPNFAMAYVGLARRYSNLNQPSLSLKYATKAYELRERVTEREKLRIAAVYFRATGELEKQEQVFELWMATYPRDGGPHGSLGSNYAFLGQYEKALEESQKAVALNPDMSINYENLGGVLLALNRLDEVKAAMDQALTRKLDGEGIHETLYYLAFLRRDFAEMKAQAAWGAGKPGDEDPFLAYQADTEAYFGRLRSAREFSRRAVDSAVRCDAKERAALWQAVTALREAEFGEILPARREITEALTLSPGRDVKVLAALALARIGEIRHARGLIEELRETYPSNTLLRIYWFPIVNAAIALKEGDAQGALAVLEPAEPYGLGMSSSLERGTIYPDYLRGQAYLMERQGEAAAVEFQKLTQHPGVVVNFMTGILARLELARSYEIAGDTTQAKMAYQEFLSDWKDADPDNPVLQKAKAEFAELH